MISNDVITFVKRYSSLSSLVLLVFYFIYYFKNKMGFNI